MQGVGQGEFSAQEYEALLSLVQRRQVGQALASGGDWSVLYHFSPERANLLQWYPFTRGATLLEIGAGCGALTWFFARRGLRVSAVEPVSAARRVLAARFQEADAGMDVSVEETFPAAEVSSGGGFSYVTLLGEHSLTAFRAAEADDLSLVLQRVMMCLVPGGHLLLALPNRLGMRYLSGAPDAAAGVPFAGIEGGSFVGQGSRRMYSRAEIVRALEAVGAVSCCWYYPYPDEIFTAQVFSDAWLPRPTDFYAGVVAYDGERVATFDERRAMKSLLPEEFPVFANSFLVDCCRPEVAR